MTYFRLKDMDFKGKKVLVRLGTDMPVDEKGNITDDRRIRISLPTVKYLIRNGATQIILMCHIDRPIKPIEKYSTEKTAERLAELLGKKIVHMDDWGENGLSGNKIVFLENVRFNPLEKDENPKKRRIFGKQLAQLADVFVQDAFSNLHHPDQASMTGMLPYLPGCLGMAPEKEISIITRAVEHPQRPFVSIIGGNKAEKLNAIHNLLKKVDSILVGCGLAFTLFKAMGKEVGDSKVDEEGLEKVNDLANLILKSKKVILPVDVVIANRFSEDAKTEVIEIDNMKQGWQALDIGPQTIRKYCDVIQKSKTVIFNGPVGVYEFEKFANGTKAIVQELTRLENATTIAGGGDSADAVKKFGNPEKMSLVSSGGGASLTLFEGRKLGGLTALEENYKKFKK